MNELLGISKQTDSKKKKKKGSKWQQKIKITLDPKKKNWLQSLEPNFFPDPSMPSKITATDSISLYYLIIISIKKYSSFGLTRTKAKGDMGCLHRL